MEPLDNPRGHRLEDAGVHHGKPGCRPPDDVAAEPARIDVRPDLAGRVLHRGVRLEQEMPAARSRDVGPRRRQVGAAVPLLRLDVLKVEVEHHELEAGRDADQRLGELPPPRTDLCRVGEAVLKAVLRCTAPCCRACTGTPRAPARQASGRGTWRRARGCRQRVRALGQCGARSCHVLLRTSSGCFDRGRRHLVAPSDPPGPLATRKQFEIWPG